MSDIRGKADFAELGRQIVATLTKAGDDKVAEAIALQESVKELAQHIVDQLGEHEKLLNEMDGRMRDFGKSVIEAHNRYLNGGTHENPSP